MIQQPSFLIIMGFIITLFQSHEAIAQKHHLQYGVGYGSSVGSHHEGSGLSYTVGYMYMMKNTRFRLNPEFTIGNYSAQNISDSRQQSFHTAQLGISVWIDIIQETAFSMMIGGGTLLNSANGLLGSEYDDDQQLINDSEYFKNYYWGGLFAIGFRFNNPDRRLNYELRPLNIHFGGVGFQEVYASLVLTVKI